MAQANEFPMSQWISCKVVRCEPPLHILPTMAGFWCEGTPVRRVFGTFCSVATRDQLQKTTFLSGNLTLWRFSKVLSRKTENCPRKCYLQQRGFGWLPSNGSKVKRHSWMKGDRQERVGREKGQAGIRSEPVTW